MKRNFSLKFVVTTILIFAAFGCAKDRNLDDFKKEQAQEDFAKLSAPAGRYSGVLTDDQGNPLGGLQMTLTPKKVSSPNSDGTAGTAAATLVGSIDYLNNTSPVSFVTQTSNYDDTTGIYTATVSITTANSVNQSLYISATIHDDMMTNGTIQSATASSNILNFTLTKNGASLSDVAAKVHDKASSADPTANQVTSYLGTTTFKTTGETKPVHILILKPRKGTAEDFLNLVIPAKLVTVSVNYGGAVNIVHTNASLDLSSNSLTGVGSLSVANSSPVGTTSTGTTTTQTGITINLDCHFENQNKTIKCEHNASSGTGLVAETTATYDSKNSADPKDSSLASPAVTQVYPAYKVTLTVDPKTGKTVVHKTGESLSLEIFYPSRNVSETLSDLFFAPSEQTVIATLVIGSGVTAIEVPLQTVRWNQTAYTLNGNGSTSSGTGPVGSLLLNCSNFKSNRQFISKEQFSCDYFSNLNAVHFQFFSATK
jgi:hypothetical protein